MRDALRKVIQAYPAAKHQLFSNHPIAQFIRGPLKKTVEAVLGELSRALTCEGSAGSGNWASVPWVGVFDPLVTDSATRGYYIVYLFSASEPEVFLSLNQGTTAVIGEFKTRAFDVLRDRTAFIRARLNDYAKHFEVHDIRLGSNLHLPQGYEAGHAFGKQYRLDAIPSDEVLRTDLMLLVQAYLALTFRGGLDPTTNFETGAQIPVEEDAPGPGATLTEIRQYRLHRKIDRHPKAAQKAKQYHGTTCQACGFSFASRYGLIGNGFIEAHHRRPLSELEEGVPVYYDVATDFVVLCSNCHRMIHRTIDSSDIEAFRQLIQSKNT
ncbi:MAG: DUF3578 domain-containing protein [Rhodospirillaceae bacterium]|nr:DUF3578 domain-containing protein [Rhodospirillaceae bacterium]